MGRVILSLLDKTTVTEGNSFSMEKAELNRIPPELQGSHHGRRAALESTLSMSQEMVSNEKTDRQTSEQEQSHRGSAGRDTKSGQENR